ncbi:MAG: ATP-binding protein [Bacteroidales bacterium]|nr:ATP-binding protein [Bacteroidales bacterium]
MKSISFKNFRRFADFPEFEFGEITILVGGNNTGKSTLLKALILLVDNMSDLKMRDAHFGNSLKPMFSFDMDHIHKLNLGTYARAHKYGSKDSLVLSAEIGDFSLSFEIFPDKPEEENSPLVSIYEIVIIDYKRGIRYTCTPQYTTLTIAGEKTDYVFIPPQFKEEISAIEEAIKKTDDLDLIANLNVELERKKEVLKSYVEMQNSEETQSGEVVIPTSDYIGLISSEDFTIPQNPLAQLVYQWVAYQTSKPDLVLAEDYEEADNDEEEEEESGQTLEDLFANGLNAQIECLLAERNNTFTREAHEANHQYLEDKMSLLRESARDLDAVLKRLYKDDDLIYIQAHAVTQRVLYTIDNRNDYMAQVLHSFSRENIQPGTEPDRFLKKWLKNLEVGLDYRVKNIEGEGYTLEIETEKDCWQHLADMGMGSNQLVTLLMELATILTTKNRKQHPLIVVEEPEQNLHPKMQSKLADLFSELNEKRGFKFLIETHSEYLIRRTQVLVAEMGLQEEELELQNPFKVYYFPVDGVPYDMKYLTSGRFENKFGEGFYDEAASSALTISKIERRKING